MPEIGLRNESCFKPPFLNILSGQNEKYSDKCLFWSENV